jgi:hypothetical protein
VYDVLYSAESVCALLLCSPDTVGSLVWATIVCSFSLGLCLRLPRGATDVNDETWSMKRYLPKMNKTHRHLSIIYLRTWANDGRCHQLCAFKAATLVAAFLNLPILEDCYLTRVFTSRFEETAYRGSSYCLIFTERY